MIRKHYLFTLIFLFSALIMWGQDNIPSSVLLPADTLCADTVSQDTVPIKDPLKIYRDIKEFAYRRKITSWLYKFVFTDPQRYQVKPVPVIPKDSVIVVEDEDPSSYEGAIIRSVEIRTLDPFGTSVEDTVHAEPNFLKAAGNSLHIRSRGITIKNQLLFKKGRPLDMLAVQESERILRQSSYVRNAKIIVSPAEETDDSVDVLVIVQDRWSIAGSVGLSTGTSKLRVTEKNFLGLAHQLNATFSYNIPDNSNYRFSGSYVVPYIRNTFITGSAFYSHSKYNYIRGVTFNRPFYSPITKWAYGISGFRNNTVQHYAVADTLSMRFPLDYHQQDGWIGKSFQLVKGKSVSRRSTKLVISGRCRNTYYLRRAPFEFDTLRLNQNTVMPLASVGISSQRYYKDVNIYKFGEPEDVPEGRILELTGGYERKEFSLRYYSGIKAGAGNYVEKIGYFSGLVGYGAFFNKGHAEDGVLNLDLSYFTDSWKWRRWTGRQFLFCRSAIGYNRERPEKITLNNEKALYGFRSDALNGHKKMLLNVVSVAYVPYQVIGFRFAAIAFAGLGMIGTNDIWDNPVYQTYGLGVLVRNDHLVFNTFMLSFGIYPNVPDEGVEYKINPISTYNFGFRDYLLGRPDIIPYR